MKRILILSFALALLYSCSNEEFFDRAPAPEGQAVSFTVDIPGASGVTKAAITAGMISNMSVLVFDQNGAFLSRSKATLKTGQNVYEALLPTSSSKRILHIVCNYDWTTFSDVASLGKGEAELIPSLSVGSGTVAYWQRVELPTGIVASSLGTTITLLRNIAQVSVVNLTTGTIRITNLSFALGDVLDRGTVSPFVPSSGTPFAEGGLTESPAGVYKTIAEANFVAAGTAVNVYERRNTGAARPAYVIIKGYYQSGGTANTTVPSYYKLDLADPNAETLLNLQRNVQYTLNVNTVANAGYATLAEAMHAPASNNVASSVLMQQFTSVSNGTSQLNIETSSRLFVKAGQSFSIKYSYIPDAGTGVVNNTGVTFSLTQEGVKPVVTGTLTNTPGTGTISGTTAALPPITDVYTATITINAGTLQRKITLRLHQPYDLSNIYSTPTKVANATDQPLDLHFTIPSSLAESDFPMPIYITTQKLSPNLDAGGTPLSLSFTGGQYRYVYMAEGPGEQVAYFTTNSASSDEQITIGGDYFRNATYALTTVSIPPLTNLSFSPNGTGLPAQKGQTVTMTFTIPVVANVNPPFNINIHTTRLTFVSSTTGTATATNYGYRYTTTRTGTQTLVFRTSQADNDEYVRVDEERYASVGFHRTCTKMDFVNPRFDAVNGLTGSAVSMRIGLPTTYDLAANDSKCDIYVYTTQLEPAAGNPSGLVAVIHPQLGAGYRYTATTRADQEVKFRAANNYTFETARIDAGGFNEALVTRYFAFGATTAFSPKPSATNNTTSNMTLTIAVPPGTIPTGGLTININSQDVLVSPTTQTNLTRVGQTTDATGYFQYLVTAPGTYTLTFRNRVNTAATRQKTITLSATNFTTTTNLN